MGIIKYYDVYKGDELIMENARAMEIEERFGVEYYTIKKYKDDNLPFWEDYRITSHGAGLTKLEQAEIKDKHIILREEWAQEWEETCKKIRQCMGT